MNYIAKNTSLQLATQAVMDEQWNYVTTAILLHTSVLWFSRKQSSWLMRYPYVMYEHRSLSSLCMALSGYRVCDRAVYLTEMSTDQDWSQFLPDQDWIGLQFFWNLADQDWIGLRKFLLF